MTNAPKRALGRTGEHVAAVGQGTWNMEREDRARVVHALQRGLDAGATHIDTAEMYGNGRVEEIVGEALLGRREEAFVVSKVLPSNASRAGTLEACDRSLTRLRTDVIDLYLLHWPGAHPLEETLAAFEELVEAGKIRFYGVSNFDADEVAEAVRLAGAGRIACNQVLYHLGERAIEHAVIDACAQASVSVVAYSPFGSVGGWSAPSGELNDRTTREGALLHELAQKHGGTPRQVALAFLLRHPSLFVIPKAGRAEHVLENSAAARLQLDQDDLARLDAAFPRGSEPRGLPMI